MLTAFRLAFPVALFLAIVGGFLALALPGLGATAQDDDLITPSPTPSPTASPTPTPSPTPVIHLTASPALTPTPTPTPWVTRSPCPQVGPTNCDVIPPKAGDADCDGQVTVNDVKVLLGDLAELDTADCRGLANVKCDDPFDIVDVLLVLQFNAELTPSIPAWCPPVGATT